MGNSLVLAIDQPSSFMARQSRTACLVHRQRSMRSASKLPENTSKSTGPLMPGT